MSGIQNQALANPLALADQIILWSSANGDTRRASITSLLELLEANITIDPDTLDGNPVTYLPFIGGTGNAITASAAVGVTLPALAAGQSFEFLPNFDNSAATTLTLGAFAVKNVSIDGAACVGGELKAGVAALLLYDGIGFQILSSGAFVSKSGTQTLVNKTLTSPTISNPTISGQISGPVGAIGAPGYSFTGDLNTGRYWTGADAMADVVGGAAALSYNTTGVAVAKLLDLSGAAAGQIKFPATQNPSADANTLDDYEEGTFTPNLGGTTTYANQRGNYTKVGNLCFTNCQLAITLIGTGSPTTISGNPFVVKSGINIVPICVGYYGSLANTSIFLSGYAPTGGSTISMTSAGGLGATMTNSFNAFGNGTEVDWCCTYLTA